ncbi:MULTISPECIES: dephospho-CoA kinase [Tenebrionibacter/Tenebrionicola group]|jgi:dephospho-CoA kinase|uniref:Dephospho-CoA kinase n=2 Tax=Tenebrionibacter/Tenebrionicola group TaxID=2969848 RepID=A0A8K0UZW4_9ENTR|nr:MULTISPECIES: dephospho-CoA kinase [Tenebrionibacter/Tenebrionicola group]MBK4713977.1 dephospho-CoA kinase [Tenebrionibacter intestinalis]MBV5094374.1 dephospho-CoA kinase [Tenebrionicola larvae]
MVYTVALTGGIGSGKSTIADAFARSGIAVIDADIIARQVVEPGKPALRAIVEHFGADMLLPDGSLNRRRLRELIFIQTAEKAWLNALLHPLIQQQTQEYIASASSPYVIWVVPLLVENNLSAKADRILVVDVSVATQLARTIKRDGVSLEQAQKIIAAQATREERLAAADDIINNDGEPQSAIAEVASLHQRYLTLAAQAAAQEKN